MKLVDVHARNEKELAILQKKIAAYVKTAGCNTGEILWGSDQGGYWVQVENDGQLGDYLSAIINKSKIARDITHEEHKGDYMWSVDHYIRPVSIVSFKL